MRALFSALAVGLLVLGSGSAMAQQSQGEPPFPPGAGVYQFVGFTDDVPTATDTINGGQGMLAMHALCQDDFGPDARMCTSEEFWLSPNAAAAADSWLLKHCTSEATASSTIWGLVVTPDGKPATAPAISGCETVRPVTCCTPLQ